MTINKSSGYLVRKSLKTRHNLIVFCNLLVGLIYLPFWLKALLDSIAMGKLFPLLVIASAYIGLKQLWHQRQKLAELSPSLIERQLGYSLMVIAAILFLFSRFAFWSQALFWVLILVGIALSSWGSKFFKKFPVPTFLLIFSAHPGLDIIFGHFWRTLTPPNFLEQMMASQSVLLLQAMGHQATLINQSIDLPSVNVEVGWACNGLDMAITLGTTGLLFGLMRRQNYLQIVKLVCLGIVLSFIFNFLRIVGLTLAANHSSETFEFWHGFWGGQIFSLSLLATYYFLLLKVAFPRKV